MNIALIEFPIAFTEAIIVTLMPPSSEVIAPTCLTPLFANTFGQACTVETPVSSTL